MLIKSNNNITRSAFEFEKIVLSIFTEYGFEANFTSESNGEHYDILAKLDNNIFAIEVKFSKTLEFSLSRMLATVNKMFVQDVLESKQVPVLILSGILSDQSKKQLQKDLIICDLSNLLYMVKDNEALKNQLIALLDFSVENIELVKPDSRLKIENSSKRTTYKKNEAEILKQRIENWTEFGKAGSRDYEKLCFDTLFLLFADDLSLWNKQNKSNDGLFIFDLICKIKDGVNKEFWNMAEKFFNTKYVIFEFKNYTDQITQKEVFTTERYLYAKGLRNIAIVISTKGTDNNAKKAIRGSLRENGKVIISLENDDLIKMLDIALNNGNPSDYLSEKLDELLISLEK